MVQLGESIDVTSLEKTGNLASNRAPIIGVLMALIALFAPIAIAAYSYGSTYDINILSMLWQLSVNAYEINFYFISSYLFVISLFSMLPFLLLRVGFAVQMTRYYQGKTTKGKTAAAAVISELPFILLFTISMIMMSIYGGFGLSFPLPLLMIIGLLVLWRFPLPEATVPWEGTDEPTPWWEDETEEKDEPPPDDDQPW